MTSDAETAATLDAVFRRDRPAVLATLIRLVGSFDVAEEALQEAMAAALEAWPSHGVPANPAGWLSVTARRRAIDRLRRDRAQADRAANLAVLARFETAEADVGLESETIVDDQLRLIFTCCHPALDMAARVALTLRVVAGLRTGEIARAFLVAEPTLGKRIVRAKRKIAEANIPYVVPPTEELPQRLTAVLSVIYLIFNEGYVASDGDTIGRPDLAGEAIRLARLVCGLLPDEPEAWALLSLLLLTDARRAARTDGAGAFVALEDQDRSRWDRELIAEGFAALDRAVQPGRRGPYLVQAAIAAMQSRPSGKVPWLEIAELYEVLYELQPSPVVALNHCAAVAFAHGPQRALELLRPLLDEPALADYQPLHAVRADLLWRSGDRSGAQAAFRRAIELSDNAVERRELQRRLAAVGAGRPPDRRG
ncbi:RNA polymerase sigma factor [Dactylosporangium matsuzakiense]|uniref:RNA polymerase subunit sigma-24 n=1 Tax=Dactylosporangium matsuzakiense TaxID=53360 RepID=A0A9W6KV08_9ACTN|nr:sigma-70 family RNA polymerase sigma factor [Dactylosporangium matsuzakiense]UWZ41411.1 sigma-70 family RNA polymerase sigma factor [Dactylosporangium matsuzakiense]GLL08611.1 RNA polymerase subunit sigma-24 [Dactylosporangium matsuzakiense]